MSSSDIKNNSPGNESLINKAKHNDIAVREEFVKSAESLTKELLDALLSPIESQKSEDPIVFQFSFIYKRVIQFLIKSELKKSLETDDISFEVQTIVAWQNPSSFEKLDTIIYYYITSKNKSQHQSDLQFISVELPKAAFLNGTMHKGVFDILWASNDPLDKIKCQLALRDDLPTSFMRRLAFDSSLIARVYIATNKHLPKFLLDILIADPQELVRSWIARRPNLDMDFIAKLCIDESHLVRETLAIHANLSCEKIEILAQDCHSGVRSAIASRPEIQMSLIEKLANDKDWSVRATVARVHLGCLSEELQKGLLTDKSLRVRMAAAKNYSSVKEIRKIKNYSNLVLGSSGKRLTRYLYKSLASGHSIEWIPAFEKVFQPLFKDDQFGFISLMESFSDLQKENLAKYCKKTNKESEIVSLSECFSYLDANQIFRILKTDLPEDSIVIDTASMFKENFKKLCRSKRRSIKKCESFMEIHDFLGFESGLMNINEFSLNMGEKFPYLEKLDNRMLDCEHKAILPKTNRDLVLWGRALRHCIGNENFARDCAVGTRAILGLKGKSGRIKYVALIENDKIVEAKGFSNSEMPYDLYLRLEKAIFDEWCIQSESVKTNFVVADKPAYDLYKVTCAFSNGRMIVFDCKKHLGDDLVVDSMDNIPAWPNAVRFNPDDFTGL